MTNPHPSEELVTRMAAAMMSEVFLLAQPDRGDVFSWLDDHSHEIARAALTAVNVDALRDALGEARRIITEIDEYQKSPERGEYGVECACCMGELLDDDRDALTKIDAALNSIGEESFGYER